MTAPLLSARGVSKRYRVAARRRAPARDLWALRDVDLDVHPGEVVAVIGRNGAGKSTLMKVVAGVTKPTHGHVSRPQRIAPLIEVGAGFHPDLTGRENVEINGQLLGLTSREVRARFDDIVGFAELEHAIDQPVGQYSSGMFMRLGFSVAIHTDPQLLIVDEVLAVGDLPFQARCLDRIRALRHGGTGVLFVTHHLTTVLELADEALLLDRGAPLCRGEPADIVGAFHALVATDGNDTAPNGLRNDRSLRLVATELVDESGRERSLWWPGERVTARLTFVADAETPEASLGLLLHKDGGGLVGAWQALDGPYLAPLAAGEEATVELSFSVNVGEGGYSIDVGVTRTDLSAALLHATGVAGLAVGARRGARGLVDLSPELNIAAVTEVTG
jgi:ABC-type polysaccharide/polyol phosphate transport system ATPase subunit